MKTLLISILFLISTNLLADPHLAKMEQRNSNIYVSTTDFAELGPFETYTCMVDMGTWFLDIRAVKRVTKKGTFYECNYGGGFLSVNVEYKVFFVLKEWPTDRVSQSATFFLTAK